MNYARSDNHRYQLGRQRILPLFEMLRPSFDRASPEAPAHDAPGLFARLMGRLQYKLAVRRTVVALSALSDRQLHDIGLHRSGIMASASEAVDRYDHTLNA